MSINWVMLAPNKQPPFMPLPGEQILYTSPPRVACSISTPSHYPGKQQQAFSAAGSNGHVYLTTRRLIYLPTQPAENFKSFVTPFLHLHDSHVTAPFFGPNVWQALLQPVNGGGIPAPATGVVELKLTFKDGGAFDFHTKFEQLKDRAQQILETSRMGENGQASQHVDLEDLPAYREESDGPLIAPVSIAQPAQETRGPPPNEPPPGYEEAQLAGLRSRTGNGASQDS